MLWSDLEIGDGIQYTDNYLEQFKVSYPEWYNQYKDFEIYILRIEKCFHVDKIILEIEFVGAKGRKKYLSINEDGSFVFENTLGLKIIKLKDE